MIRAFVGIPVPPDVVRILTAAQSGLRIGRPVAPENFHLTLAFLDKHPEPVLEDVHTALERISVPGFDIRLDGLGTFGAARARVLFADVAPAPALTQLRRKVRQAARDGGVELAHARFHPHVTLARFGAGLRGEEALELQGFLARRIGRAQTGFRVTEFNLYESRLGREGPTYSVLSKYPLAAPA